MQGAGVEGITSSFPAKDHARGRDSRLRHQVLPSKLLNWSTDIYIYLNIYICILCMYMYIMTFNILGEMSIILISFYFGYIYL